MRPVEYPLLGEPVVVELCNTLYVGEGATLDFLGDLDLARGWLAALGPSVLERPDRFRERDRRDLVELRRALREIFGADTSARPTDEALAALERALHLAPPRPSVGWSATYGLTVEHHHDRTDPAGVLSLLAHEAVEVLGGDRRVLVCDRPACEMRFLQQHRRRRYCNPACANADRQRRFHDRHRRSAR